MERLNWPRVLATPLPVRLLLHHQGQEPRPNNSFHILEGRARGSMKREGEKKRVRDEQTMMRKGWSDII